MLLASSGMVASRQLTCTSFHTSSEPAQQQEAQARVAVSTSDAVCLVLGLKLAV
jgi:hypothetical protein